MKKLLLISLILFNSCVHTQDKFKEQIFYIHFNKSLPDYDEVLSIQGGEVDKLTVSDSISKEVYKLHFHEVKGGATFFIGNKINEIHGYKEKRFNISIENQIIEEYSINDLITMNKVKIDTLEVIYIPLKY